MLWELAQGEELTLNYVFDGDKDWMQHNGGEVVDIPVTNIITQVFPMDSLNAILSLMSSDINLSTQPETEINGRPAVCIRMEIGGEWARQYMFDPETKLVVASKKTLFDTVTGGTKSVGTYYSNYQLIDGLNIPMSIETVINGESTATITVTDVRFMETIDQSVFAKPVPSRN